MAETGFKKWIITVTVILAALLELIDTTVVNVSLPQIMEIWEQLWKTLAGL